jgi:hypothetical protein
MISIFFNLFPKCTTCEEKRKVHVAVNVGNVVSRALLDIGSEHLVGDTHHGNDLLMVRYKGVVN